MISNIDHPGGGQGQDPSPRSEGGSQKPALPGKFDTGNNFLVGVQGETLVVMNPPHRPITRLEALNLASWLLCLAGVIDARSGRDFEMMVEQVKNS